jgi:hypothetical protein
MALATVEIRKTDVNPRKWVEILDAFCEEPVIEVPRGGTGPGPCKLRVVERIELTVQVAGFYDDSGLILEAD